MGIGRYDGVETDRVHEQKAGEHCAIFYDTRKWQVCKQDTFWLSDTPELPGSRTWGNDLPRIVTWAILESSAGAPEIAVFNTHFHWGEPVVQNSTHLLLEKIKEITSGTPTILTADFNLGPDSPTHQAFTQQGGLTDCWQACGHPEEGAGTYHNFSGKGKARIDWILVSKHWQPKHIERITFNRAGRYPSDHFPVRVELLSAT